MQKIDLSDLQNEVIQHWEDTGIRYSEMETLSNDPPLYESCIKPRYQDILDDWQACIEELGFEKISDYLASKQEDYQFVLTKVTFMFAGFLNREFVSKRKSCI